MPESLLNKRVDAIRRLARRGAIQALAKVVATTRAEDLAAAIGQLARNEQRLVFGQVRADTTAADLLVRIGDQDFLALTADLPVERLVRLFGEMEADDQTDLIELLPEDKREAVLARLHGEEREQMEELLGYPPDSAGGIMSPLAFRLREDITCRDAIAAVQEASDHELVYYVYVESESGQLVGVTSLRNLLTHPPSTRLSDIMTTDVIAVDAHTDQEEVARIAGRYDLLAVPVVDDQRRLLGIVTVDDVIDVIREEAAEDMLLMAGVGEEPSDSAAGNRLSNASRRLPWLLVTLLGGIVISEIIRQFSGVLAADLVLAGFIPMLTGMSGNVGIQSATLTVRNIALGRLDVGVGARLGGEAITGLLLGVVFSVLVGLYCMLRYGDVHTSLAVGIAITCNTTAAALMGMLVPLTLRRIGIDPAIATGPFVTTAMDGVGVTVYLGIAAALLSL
ncbi:MAG: magnesium transporter [Pseudomonadota bacterium]|nr:magnesium transporter [Pseudomonadota bacterium]